MSFAIDKALPQFMRAEGMYVRTNAVSGATSGAGENRGSNVLQIALSVALVIMVVLQVHANVEITRLRALQTTCSCSCPRSEDALQNTLMDLLARDHGLDRDLLEEAGADMAIDEVPEVLDMESESINVTRTKREATEEQSLDGKEDSKNGARAKSKRRQNKRDRRQAGFFGIRAAHFVANEHEAPQIDSVLRLNETTWSMASQLTHYHRSSGKARVKNSGLYFLYVQVTFKNHHGKNGFTVVKEKVRAGKEDVLRCAAEAGTVGGGASHEQTCAGVTVLRLERGEHLYVRANHQGRNVSAMRQSTHWGLFRLGGQLGRISG